MTGFTGSVASTASYRSSRRGSVSSRPQTAGATGRRRRRGAPQTARSMNNLTFHEHVHACKVMDTWLDDTVLEHMEQLKYLSQQIKREQTHPNAVSQYLDKFKRELPLAVDKATQAHSVMLEEVAR